MLNILPFCTEGEFFTDKLCAWSDDDGFDITNSLSASKSISVESKSAVFWIGSSDCSVCKTTSFDKYAEIGKK